MLRSVKHGAPRKQGAPGVYAVVVCRGGFHQGRYVRGGVVFGRDAPGGCASGCVVSDAMRAAVWYQALCSQGRDAERDACSGAVSGVVPTTVW